MTFINEDEIKEEGEERKLPKLHEVDGKKYPLAFTAKNLRSAREMSVRPSDIFVCTDGKAGTTWLQHIVHLLLGRTPYEEVNGVTGRKSTLTTLSPMIEFFGADYCARLPAPRVLKSHLPFNDIPKHPEAKYILGVRNIKDTLVSAYFHCKNFKFYEWSHGELENFVPLYLEGQLGGMSYFEHLRSWLAAYEARELPILLVKYEDMVRAPAKAIHEIGRFLGGEAASSVEDETTLQKILHASSLYEMRKRQDRWIPEGMTFSETFIRRGEVGNWRDYLSEKQSRLIDEKFASETAGTMAATWWSGEMEWLSS